MEHIAAACMGFCLDWCIGDPQNWWHPVRAIGRLIEILEHGLRRLFPKTKQGELAGGAVMAAAVPLAAGAVSWGILYAAGRIHPALRLILMTIMSWQILAARSLKTESMKVYHALKNHDVDGARYAVSMIVGRDTAALTREGIIKAAVETVAENASDGVIAPLCFLLLAGPVGGFMYKAVNTMDSMVGYRNERYQWFGSAAARMDDLVNWIPARLTAILMILAAFLLPELDGKEAFRIWRRDRRCHKSPNSAQGESACAGALRVRLAGDAWYFGKLHHKPTIGDDDRPVEEEDIRRANDLMYAAVYLALLPAVVWLGIRLLLK